jgi:hypothetical protein
MARGSRFATALMVTVALGGTLVTVLGTPASAPAGAALPGTTMPLQEFVNDGAGGRVWNNYDQTASSGGPTIAGRPSPIAYGATVHVYARANNGDLIEFINDGFGGRVWNAYNLTQITGGPTIAADPGAAFFGPIVHVYAEASNGDLIEFVNDGAGGRLWNAYDLTQIAGGPTLGGDPTPSITNTTDRVFARSSSGDLVEYVNDGAGGQLWNAYDLTQLASSVPIAGDPNPVVTGSIIHIYAAATSGDLVEYADDDQGGQLWNAYDLTAATGGPTVTGRPSPLVVNGIVDVFARASTGVLTEFAANNLGGHLWNAYGLSSGPAVSGDPSAIAVGNAIHVYAEATGGDLTEFYNAGSGQTFTNFDLSVDAAGPGIGGDPGALLYGSASIHVYAGGPPPPPPPEGVGLYGLSPGASTSQAIEDNWPIIGDTGALGTQSAPYTGFNLGADLTTGQDIAASGKRVTWLSFWTVSGPASSNSDGSACFTSDCYYSDGYGAGQYVATTIDSYRSSGLGLKPDWVILDPEGYPDNHSGLDNGAGATSANWSSLLTGWANGLASVDPALHPGFYADQFEYNTFDLAAIQLPAFVAIAFPGPVNVLQNPTNVAGFIAFGASCPATGEEQTLTGAGWSGAYNTLQFAGAQYCGP